MTTFTITSNSDMDSLATKTGADVYNVNGAVLTINSDTRWGKNTSSTIGPFGNITVSSTLGGSVVIDGTQVWLLPFDNGAGVVPAAGDTITGAGGCTGELLGVWTAINTTPTAAPAAMPATGFIKLKSKTTTFTDNEALTGTGMTADVNSSVGGYRGWLEIVGQESGTMTVPRLGDATFNGDWFYLDDTTGTPGQILQAPNSGGTNSYYPAIEIETGVGTGIYEAYPAINAATVVGSSPWSNTGMGTDARCKFVEMMSSGRFRIGSDGTNNVGYTPVSGLKVRIPNLIFTNTTSANRAINVVPNATLGTRYDFVTTNAGDLVFDKVMFNWYVNSLQAYSVVFSNMFYCDAMLLTETASPIDFTNVVNGNYSHLDAQAMQVATVSSGMTFTNCKFGRTGFVGNSDISLYAIDSQNISIVGGEIGPRTTRTSTGCSAIYIITSKDISITDNTAIGARVIFSGCSNIRINDQVYADVYFGTTGTANSTYSLQFLDSSDIIVDGFSLFPGISNIAPYGALTYTANSFDLTFRNFGTYASPIDLNTVNPSSYVFYSSSGTKSLIAKRIYAINNSSLPWRATNTDDEWYFENFHANYADLGRYSANNFYIRGGRMSWFTNGQTAVYGSHFYDIFDSTTTGILGLALNEKTTREPSASVYTISGGTPRFNSIGSLKMDGLTDEIIYEMQYFAIGHTGFQNVAPTLAGTATGNMTYEYDININDGNGFTGSYKTLNGANLSAETVDATLGFKLRIKISTNTASSTTLLNNLYVSTTSTTTTQAYQYPLSTYNLTFTGLQTGTVIMILSAATETQLAKLTETAGTAVYTFSADNSGDSVDYAILAPGYTYQRQSAQTLPSSDTTISVVQQVDYGYDAGASALVTFDGVTKKITMDGGATELDVIGMYSDYIDWALTGTNLKYNFAFDQAGGQDIDIGAGTSIPVYTFLTNGWKIAPDEASHTLTVSGGILLVSGGGDPFDDTAGAYTVRINYQQPVQAITVSSGGGGTTPAAVWSYATRELSASGVTAVQSGIATSAEIAALNDLSAAEVNAEVDTALADYDGPTKAELDTAIGTVTTNQGVINVGVQKASKLIPHSTDL